MLHASELYRTGEHTIHSYMYLYISENCQKENEQKKKTKIESHKYLMWENVSIKVYAHRASKKIFYHRCTSRRNEGCTKLVKAQALKRTIVACAGAGVSSIFIGVKFDSDTRKRNWQQKHKIEP